MRVGNDWRRELAAVLACAFALTATAAPALAEPEAEKRGELARRVQALALGMPPDDGTSPDARLRGQLRTLTTAVARRSPPWCGP